MSRRLFLSLDLDAFYCAVEEHDDPSLKGTPFCVIQKFVVATLSYPARAMGLKKLMSVNEVKKRFPEMKMINGESLAKYRAAGKQIYDWLGQLTGGSVERLGLEELRIELTDSIDFSLELPMVKSFLQSSSQVEELFDDAGYGVLLTWAASGITFECSDFFFHFDGITYPSGRNEFRTAVESEAVDAYISGHFACYIRDRMNLELGYGCSVGVGSTKTYAKIACSMNKPSGVAVLLPGYEFDWLKDLPLRSIPGFGSNTIRKLRDEMGLSMDSKLLVGDVHEYFKTKQTFSNKTDANPSLWDIIDGTEAPDDVANYSIPTQVSIEDTYPPSKPSHMLGELDRLIESLISQVSTDLIVDSSWIGLPYQFVVSIMFINQGYRRKAKSHKVTLSDSSDDNVTSQLKSLQKTLQQLAKRLLKSLTPNDEPIRLINVCLKIAPNESLIK